ncbi:hypothetical protein F2Q68_00025999 [Brassica cretica]|uniref:Reverse transcriptase zinc-binding domain-containing protein n=1 Tax=Brassica cretica TaxID=69181 RepID=A0A8S9I7R9_BRACR|nr:hypothetical protein F2Q68_00025999 [Brassica cretica]
MEATTQTPDWKKLIWTGETSPKIRLFLWKITQGSLPTGANLQQRGLMQHTTCVRCGELETEAHLFLHCNYARQVWTSSLFRDQLDPSAFPTFLDALTFGKTAVGLPPLGVVADIFPWVCLYIRIARNQMIFEKRFIKPEITVSKAIWSAREWKLAQPTVTQKPCTIKQVIIPDLDDLIVSSSDAAWRKETNMAGFGCIFMDK